MTSFWTHETTPFLSGERKGELAASGESFTVIRVIPEDQSPFGPRWLVVIDLNGEQYKITFAPNATRDAMLQRLKSHVESEGPVVARLVKDRSRSGRTFYSLAPPLL